MYKIIALVCSLNVPHDQCTIENARSHYILGKDLGMFECMRQAQMTDAQTVLGLNSDEYMKYECVNQ